MRERPIPFSGPMVRAILAGTKTQTRRVVKPQPEHPHFASRHMLAVDDEGVDLYLHSPTLARAIRCPYGRPGDRLWVRETHIDLGACYLYRADASAERERALVAPGQPWRPSIHMSRAASRITLEITAVRVERLQDISDADAWNEGIDASLALSMGCTIDAARAAYSHLWESINGPGSWDENPWVWVVEFKSQGGDHGPR